MSLLSLTLFCLDLSATLSAISWAQLRLPLETTSDTVVSSTSSPTLSQLSTSKSFISSRNGHGPSSLRDPRGHLALPGVTGLREFDSLGTIRKEICDPIDNSCKQIRLEQILYEYSTIHKVKRSFIIKKNSSNLSAVGISPLDQL